jgi:hypothetical protein
MSRSELRERAQARASVRDGLSRGPFRGLTAHLPRRSRFLVAGIAVLAALVFGVSAALAGTTYFNNGTLCSGCAAYSGYNYWSQNEVYRPIGYSFALWFQDTGGGKHGYTTNSGSNPFIISGSYGYTRAACENVSGSSVSPVTCIAS